MEIKRKNKILIWTALVLLVLNITTIGTIWIEKQIENKRHREIREARKNYRNDVLVKELELNEQQIAFYTEKRKQHWNQLRALKHQISKAKAGVHNEIFSAAPDTNRIFNLIDSIGFYNAEIERNNYRHFLELKEKLDSSQVLRFHQLMDDMLKRGNARNEHFRESRRFNEK